MSLQPDSSTVRAVDDSPRWLRIGRPLLGAALLIAIVAKLDPARIGALAREAHWPWFALALGLTASNQLITSLRWKRICAALGLSLSWRRAVQLVFQAIAGNSVLPGGVVAGDAWRIARVSAANAPAVDRRVALATASVLLDRVSGLWALSIVSLAGWIVYRAGDGAQPAGSGAYAALLAFIAFLPLSSWWIGGRDEGVMAGRNDNRAAGGVGDRVGGRLARITTTVARSFGVLLQALPASLLVQAFACAALVASYRTLGVTLDGWLIVAVGALVFVAAALPASIGGFGARELAAVAVFVPLGMGQEAAFAGSVLFGLTNSVMGIIGALAWLFSRR